MNQEIKDWRIFLVISGLAAFILIAAANIDSLSRKIQSQKNELAGLTEAAGNLPLLETDLENSKAAQSSLESRLPAKENLTADFPKYLEDLAKKYNLGMGFNFGEITAGGLNAPGTIAFRLNLVGAYSGLADFLSAARKGSYFIQWDHLELNQRGSSFEAEIDGKTFYNN